jgi:hypothetical protein
MKILDYLNYLYPTKPTEQFFYSGLSFPEPFEIPLYVILSILFVGIIAIFSLNKLQKLYEDGLKRLGLGKYFIFIFLLLLFINKLGTFPLAGDLLSYPAQTHKDIYTFFFLLILGFILFFILQTIIIQKIIVNKTAQMVISLSILALIIGISVFTPHFSFSMPDLSFFLGPVYEIASGKTIFTNIPSQYGFLSILFFTAIYSITHLKFVYLPIIFSLFYICEYLICFYLIVKSSRSLVFSFLGIFSILIINLLASTYGPQAGAIRWILIFLVVLLVYKLRRFDHPLLLFLIPILSFWSIDAGIYLIIGYVFSLILLFAAKKITFRKLLTIGSALFLSFIFIVGIIEATHILLGLQPVDFFKIYHSIRKYALAGVGMVPMEFHSYFWLFILLYFSSVLYFFLHTHDDVFDQIILLAANFMLFSSIYYIGRSMPHELYTISIMALLTFLLLIGRLYSSSSFSLRFFILSFIFIFFIVFPLNKRIEYVTAKILEKYQGLSEGQIFKSKDQFVQNYYSKEIELINKNITENQVLILSPDDSYLFYLINKKNILNANPVWGYIQMQSEIAPALQQAVKICPKKIVTDCELFKQCPAYEKLTFDDQVTFPIILSEIEKQCKIIYSPKLCTDKLCIAEANK